MVSLFPRRLSSWLLLQKHRQLSHFFYQSCFLICLLNKLTYFYHPALFTFTKLILNFKETDNNDIPNNFWESPFDDFDPGATPITQIILNLLSCKLLYFYNSTK